MSDFLIIGDPHFTNKITDKATQLFELVESYKLPTIWLGDIFDTKEVIKGKTLNQVLDYFSTSKLQHTLLVGNHDFFSNDCEDHSLRTLGLLPNVTIIDKPTKKANLVFFPYTHNSEILKGWIKEFSAPDLVLFGHLEVTEFDFGNGFLCTAGIALEDLKNFKKVISGHFHKFQLKDNLVYLGTPMSHSFGEANQTKFVGLFDSETFNLELIETQFPSHIQQTIEIDTVEYIDFMAILSDKKDLHRIKIIGNPENFSKVNKKDFESGGKYQDFNVQFSFTEKKPQDTTFVINEDVSNAQQFKDWATQFEQLSEETIELGISLLQGIV